MPCDKNRTYHNCTGQYRCEEAILGVDSRGNELCCPPNPAIMDRVISIRHSIPNPGPDGTAKGFVSVKRFDPHPRGVQKFD